jgi:hypothetical protein
MARTAVIVGPGMAGWEWIAKGQEMASVGLCLRPAGCTCPARRVALNSPTRKTLLSCPFGPGRTNRPRRGSFRAFPKTVGEKGTVPFCSQSRAKLGQSPTVFGQALWSAAAPAHVPLVRRPRLARRRLPRGSCVRAVLSMFFACGTAITGSLECPVVRFRSGFKLNWELELLEWNCRFNFRQTPKLKGDL